MKYTQSDKVKFSVIMYNNFGEIHLPATAVFSIRKQDGTEVYTEILTPVDGNYTTTDIDFANYNWVYEYYGDDFYSGQFEVIPTIITPENLSSMKLWIDFSSYSSDEISSTILLAQELVSTYLGFKLSDWLVKQEGKTVISHDGELHISLKQKWAIIKVVSIEVRVPGIQRIKLDISAIDLNREAWYVAYSTVKYTNNTYPSRIMNSAEVLRYEVQYLVNNRNNPILTRALWMVCANIFRADQLYQQTGMQGAWYSSGWLVKSFSSGKYSVSYGSGNNWTSIRGNSWDDFLTDNVKALLKPLKPLGQSTF